MRDKSYPRLFDNRVLPIKQRITKVDKKISAMPDGVVLVNLQYLPARSL